MTPPLRRCVFERYHPKGDTVIFVLLMIVWLMLNGRADWDVWVTGIVVSGAIYYVLHRLSGLSFKTELRAIRLLPLVFAYIGVLLWEILKANKTVAGLICSKKEPDPMVVHFSSGLRSESANVILANSITLTPGTITILLQEDRFAVHCLRREYGEGMGESSFVKLLSKMEEIWYK